MAVRYTGRNTRACRMPKPTIADRLITTEVCSLTPVSSMGSTTSTVDPPACKYNIRNPNHPTAKHLVKLKKKKILENNFKIFFSTLRANFLIKPCCQVGVSYNVLIRFYLYEWFYERAHDMVEPCDWLMLGACVEVYNAVCRVVHSEPTCHQGSHQGCGVNLTAQVTLQAECHCKIFDILAYYLVVFDILLVE